VRAGFIAASQVRPVNAVEREGIQRRTGAVLRNSTTAQGPELIYLEMPSHQVALAGGAERAIALMCGEMAKLTA
jgi:hypothetical protein